ncbi:MAG: peptide deformylase [Candidatus Omnitrophota bacterium]|nr:peptide deformylase [Candidatus Omnitrophota bacterium]
MTVATLKIRIYGDPCLREKCRPVDEVGPSERLLIRSMLATMYEHKGIGLAAPQIGINQQILVADAGDGPVAVINPRIVKKSGSSVLEEGCLSIPGVVVNVRRPVKIVLQYVDENNRTVEREFNEMLARVLQHETDHLHGKLIIDYAGLKDKLKIRRQLREILRKS